MTIRFGRGLRVTRAIIEFFLYLSCRKEAVEKSVDAVRITAQTGARSLRPVIWTALRHWDRTDLTPSQSHLALR